MVSHYCVFKYMYRDAGNWKTYGELLLQGEAVHVLDELRECLDWGDIFVAEQVGIPSLCAEHFASCGDGPSDLDHAYHEFIDIQPATQEDLSNMKVASSLEDLMVRMRVAAGHWDVLLSPNCWL